jgi:parvulin-like peptidyl-prolyl isomerase
MKTKSLTFVCLVIVLIGFFSSFSTVAKADRVPQARASHILVDTEYEVDELKQEIEKVSYQELEAKFAQVAQEKSKCPSSRKGGDLGYFGRGEMVPEFDKVVFESELGKIHKVKTQFGWHLVFVTERSGMGDNKDL